MGRLKAVVAVLAGPLLAAVGCETVDLGNPPADINACRPSQTYFVGSVVDGGAGPSIWIDVLDKDYGGKKCHDSACHGTASTNSLKLEMPTSCAPPACPIPLTQEMEANYRSTAEQMNCSNVMASKLLEYPAGLKTHFGGKLFDITDPEAAIIIGWVGAVP